MSRNLQKTNNDDVSYTLPAGGITLSVPFTVDIRFNKAVENISVSREIDDADFDQTLITTTTWNNTTFQNYLNDTRWPGDVYTECTRLFFNYVFQTFPEVRFIITYNRSTEPTLSITEVLTNANGIAIKIADHGLSEGNSIQVSSTTNYNGIYRVYEVIDDDYFVIEKTYVANETSGTVKLCLIETIYNQRIINHQKLEGVTE